MFKSPGCLSFRSLPFRFERCLKARGTDLGPNSRKDCSTERSQAESRRLEDMLTADKITKVAKTTEPRPLRAPRARARSFGLFSRGKPRLLLWGV